jgi:hypothetical protein
LKLGVCGVEEFEFCVNLFGFKLNGTFLSKGFREGVKFLALLFSFVVLFIDNIYEFCDELNEFIEQLFGMNLF